MEIYRTVTGARLPHNAALQAKFGFPVDRQAVGPGDLLFFTEPGKGITHVGLALGGSQFIHASTSKGVCTGSLNQPYYRERFWGARRLSQAR